MTRRLPVLAGLQTVPGPSLLRARDCFPWCSLSVTGNLVKCGARVPPKPAESAVRASARPPGERQAHPGCTSGSPGQQLDPSQRALAPPRATYMEVSGRGPGDLGLLSFSGGLMCSPGRGHRAGNTGHPQTQPLPAVQAAGRSQRPRVLTSSRRPRRCRPDEGFAPSPSLVCGARSGCARLAEEPTAWM